MKLTNISVFFQSTHLLFSGNRAQQKPDFELIFGWVFSQKHVFSRFRAGFELSPGYGLITHVTELSQHPEHAQYF
jgi:hypothetical protein